MPVVDTEQLESMLVTGQIKAITLDANIFIGRNKIVYLDKPSLRPLAGLGNKQIEFFLSGTVSREIRKHLQDNYKNAYRDVKKSIKSALRTFGTSEPTLENLLNQITGGSDEQDAATKRMERFIRDTKCRVLEDEKHIDMVSINNDYFDINPPFEDTKGKKCEYPDAIALNAIEGVAKERNMGILVVSNDKGWKKYCDNSTSNLFCLKQLDHALDLISKAPTEVRNVIKNWFADESAGREELINFLGRNVEEIYFDASGYPSSHLMDTYSYMGELKDVFGLDDDIYIIDAKCDNENNCIRLTVSLALTLNVIVPIDLSFYVRDSIDKENISMGGRGIEHEQELSVTASAVIEIFHLGREDEIIELVNTELDINNYEIDLGLVVVYGPEDYD